MSTSERLKSLVGCTADLLASLNQNPLRAAEHWYHNEMVANQLAEMLALLPEVASETGRSSLADPLVLELRHVFGLTGSPLRPAHSFDAIAAAYRSFAEHLMMQFVDCETNSTLDPETKSTRMVMLAV